MIFIDNLKRRHNAYRLGGRIEFLALLPVLISSGSLPRTQIGPSVRRLLTVLLAELLNSCVIIGS